MRKTMKNIFTFAAFCLLSMASIAQTGFVSLTQQGKEQQIQGIDPQKAEIIFIANSNDLVIVSSCPTIDQVQGPISIGGGMHKYTVDVDLSKGLRDRKFTIQKQGTSVSDIMKKMVFKGGYRYTYRIDEKEEFIAFANPDPIVGGHPTDGEVCIEFRSPLTLIAEGSEGLVVRTVQSKASGMKVTRAIIDKSTIAPNSVLYVSSPKSNKLEVMLGAIEDHKKWTYDIILILSSNNDKSTEGIPVVTQPNQDYNTQQLTNNNQTYNTNQGYNNYNQNYQGYNPNNQGYYQNNQGYNPNNQSYNQNNQGYNPNNQGYNQNNQGYNQNNQGYNPNNQGYNQNNQGYYPNNQGYNPNNQGYNQNNQGYNQNNQGYNQNNQGYNQNNQGYNPNNQGYNQNNQGYNQNNQTYNQQNTQNYNQNNQGYNQNNQNYNQGNPQQQGYNNNQPYENQNSNNQQVTQTVTEPIAEPIVEQVAEPVAEPTIIALTLQVNDNAEIWINGSKKANGSYNSTFAPGTYQMETRQGTQRSEVQNITITAADNGRTITLTPPPPATGSIIVNCIPTDATIYIDDVDQGQSPKVVSNVKPGSHMVKIVKQGYIEHSETVSVEAGRQIELKPQLREACLLSFNCNAPQATFFLNGKSQGSVKEETTVATGTYQLLVRANGYDDYTTTLTLAAGKQTINCELNIQKGNRTISVGGVNFTMIYVEGGTFEMGATSEQGKDAPNEEKPVHKVTLSNYFIGETEVTQELWEAVTGENPAGFLGVERPIENISYRQVQFFIEDLNEKTGLTFRLPTEAEWEYAARGGQQSKRTRFSGGETASDVAWIESNSNSTTHPVKSLRPNELGIYDMSGNVWEWCADYYDALYYKNSESNNPKGPAQSTSRRTNRGGSWHYDESACNISRRTGSLEVNRSNEIGFRLAL